MAALAYLAPPISGLVAFLRGNTTRVRRHGLQSVLVGAAWPALLYLASAVAPAAAQAAFGAGVVVWLALFVGTAAGKDPMLPGVRSLVARAAVEPPLESPTNGP